AEFISSLAQTPINAAAFVPIFLRVEYQADPLWVIADICSAKRHVRFTPRKRTFGSAKQMSALGQKRTHAPQQKRSLFDHLVGAQITNPRSAGAGREKRSMLQRGLAAATYPAVTSSLWAAKAARTSAFSRFGTLAKSRLRPGSAATSSNSAGEMRRSRWASSRPSGVLPGLVAVNWKGPPETLQTQSVRMNLRPGNLPRFLVCHSRSCRFLDFWPTMGFFTT